MLSATTTRRSTILGALAALSASFGMYQVTASLEEPLASSLDSKSDTPHGKLFLLPLRRDVRPVTRQGKVVSFKTIYSGAIQAGTPAQDFNVVFDTGSGHVALPSVRCTSDVCMSHSRYNFTASSTANSILISKRVVRPQAPTDVVTITFGTGKIVGSFVSDMICLGDANDTDGLCIRLGSVMAKELSENPFAMFNFDGVCGLGLPSLALDPDFSFFNVLSRSGQLAKPQFSFFVTGDDEEDRRDGSELAIGGYNPERIASPVQWVDVPNPKLGFWAVKIVAVHVGDVTFDICQDGCSGIMDTGTSHMGIPAAHSAKIEDMLTAMAGDLLDCRLSATPPLKIEFPGFNITLNAEDYMRRLPLRGDLQFVDSVGAAPIEKVLDPSAQTERVCRPRVMPVTLPSEFGNNIFILGEPILHRYVTVFDWNKPAVGFGVAKREPSNMPTDKDFRGKVPDNIELYLMQQGLSSTVETV